MSFATMSEVQKSELVVSLAALLCEDAGVQISASNLDAAIIASGNKVAPYWTSLFASYLTKSDGCEKFMGKPGSGGGAASAKGETTVAAAVVEEPEEEEEEIDMGGGMDMFGGGEGGADY